MHKPRSLLVTFAIGLLVACATPDHAPDRASESAAGSTAQPTLVKSGAVVLDKSCKSDTDCTVKNVGNCCGYYPACVNKDSPTDPAGVQAQCRAQGRVGVCGFPSIASCQCRNGQCESAGSGAIRVDGPVPLPTR